MINNFTNQTENNSVFNKNSLYNSTKTFDNYSELIDIKHTKN